MKMPLSSAVIDSVLIVTSKKNSGGPVCQIRLSATMTKMSRRHMKIEGVPIPKQRQIKDADTNPNDDTWPPHGEKAGKLKACFQATELYLKGKQGNTLGEPEEVSVKVSLADGFTWKLEDPKDEENRTVRYSFIARTTDLASIEKMINYQFSSSSGDNKGKLAYNKAKEAGETEEEEEEEGEEE